VGLSPHALHWDGRPTRHIGIRKREVAFYRNSPAGRHSPTPIPTPFLQVLFNATLPAVLLLTFSELTFDATSVTVATIALGQAVVLFIAHLARWLLRTSTRPMLNRRHSQ